MLQIISYLKEDLKINNKDIIYINMENLDYDHIKDYKDLDKEIK